MYDFWGANTYRCCNKYKMIWKTTIVVILAVGVLAEIEVSDEQRNQLKEILRQQCKKNGNEDKFEEVETVVLNFADCIKNLFDVETLKKEIESAKPNGALDEVFKKYCEKSPQLKTCIHSLSSGVKPCLDVNLRDHVATIDNTTDQLIEFLCYKDGDRIALFIAEGGPECFQEKTSSIRECASKLTKGVVNVETAISLTQAEQCAKFDEASACIVKALEECSTPTPGNMAESLFRFIRKSTPCGKTA